MKGFIAMMVLLSVPFSYTYAGEGYESYEKKQPTRMEDREVISWDHDLELELDGNIVYASWDEFPEDMGFDWFKLVYSTTNSKPVYPRDATIFVGSRTQTETSFRLKEGNTHYIRLCAVILNDDYSKDRYCGDVQTFEKEYVGEEKRKEYYEKEKEMTVCTMEYAPVCGKKDGKYQVYSNNCMREAALAYKVDKKYCEAGEDTREEVKMKENTFGLSLTLRKRINDVLEDFVERLDNRGDSDEEIAETIEVVLERLEKLQVQEKYKNIAGYMIQELRAMQEKYNDPLGELESIFDDL